MNIATVYWNNDPDLHCIQWHFAYNMGRWIYIKIWPMSPSVAHNKLFIAHSQFSFQDKQSYRGGGIKFTDALSRS